MVELADVQRARERLVGRVSRTEVTPDYRLGKQAGAEVWLKWESQQITGSFKVRGALNAIIGLPQERRSAGVTASSSGNHGMGVCYAARETTIPALVCVPNYASQKKINAMRELGAEVQVLDGPYSLAEATAIDLAQQRDAVFVSPYGHPDVIAGQGTVMLEWLEQTPGLDMVLLPVGGGGLASGIGLALKARRPTSLLIGAQTKGSAILHAHWRGDDMGAVEIVPNLADGITGRLDPQAVTLPLVRRLLDDFVLVDDEEIARAVAYCYDVHHQVVEGAGAVGLAALLAGKVVAAGRSVGVLITGSNVTPEAHREMLDRACLQDAAQMGGEGASHAM